MQGDESPLFCGRNLGVGRDCGLTNIPCRSEPARDGGVSGNEDIDWSDAFASRLAPTGGSADESGFVFWHITRVGASLLAKAVCQATKMLTGLTLSRAGSLLQGIFVVAGIGVYSVIFSKLR